MRRRLSKAQWEDRYVRREDLAAYEVELARPDGGSVVVPGMLVATLIRYHGFSWPDGTRTIPEQSGTPTKLSFSLERLDQAIGVYRTTRGGMRWMRSRRHS